MGTCVSSHQLKVLQIHGASRSLLDKHRNVTKPRVMIRFPENAVIFLLKR